MEAVCGLAGLYRPNNLTAEGVEDSVHRMSRKLLHRGPDSHGCWFDHEAGIALGHRRLAIVDTSNAGHQPMTSASGRYVVSLNGEIYNHMQLRQQLDNVESAVKWRGHSDTESLLAGIDAWGIEATLNRCTGMFAFALWDRDQRVLTLARDRLGEKPLYYGWQNGSLVFASELKSLREFAGFAPDIDRNVLARYMRYSYISGPNSIYANVFKLMPGTFMQFSARQKAGELPEPSVYWSLGAAIELGLDDPFMGSDEEATDLLERKLQEAISLQRIADVPLGAFLSGGVDSSTMVAVMQSQASEPVRTFTIGFEDSDFDEATHARAVADHLKTDHCELYVTSSDAQNAIPKLPEFYDEPFGDSSAIPTLLVSELARKSVTVSISGDGGDELFGGYTRYQKTLDDWSRLGKIPYGLRRPMSSIADSISRMTNDSVLSQKSHRLARYLSARSWMDMYDVRITQLAREHGWVKGNDVETGSLVKLPGALLQKNQMFEAMLYLDAMQYLPDDILVKVDRASMAASLESRVPMLSHGIVEFAWTLPRHMKIRDGQSKWLLKQVLHRYVPKHLTVRPKMGFGVPVDEWLRGPLLDWAESQLSTDRLQEEGFLNTDKVRGLWRQHLQGAGSTGAVIWNVLMFQSWLAAQA